MKLGQEKNIIDIIFDVNNRKDDGVVGMIGNSYVTFSTSPKKMSWMSEESDELKVALTGLFNKIKKKAHDNEQYISSKPENSFEFGYTHKDTDGKYYNLRCYYSNSVNGYDITIRVKPPSDNLPTLEELDINKAIKEILLSDELSSGGLCIFSAVTGEGKTTSATASILSRLLKFGGHCNAYESPPEYDMSGKIGDKAKVQQTDVYGDYPKHLKGSLRRYPVLEHPILFLGEINDAEIAKYAIIASAQGHLVFATIHANSLLATFKKLIDWAGSEGSIDSASDILSSTFRFCLHQKKTFNKGAEGWKQFKITGDCLYSLTKKQRELLGNTIKKREFDNLTDFIDRQKQALEEFKNGDIPKEELFNKC